MPYLPVLLLSLSVFSCHSRAFLLCHSPASVARPGDFLDCRVKPDNDNYLFVIPRFSSFPRHIWAFLPLSHPRASVARSGDLLDCRVKPEYDGKKNKPDNGRKRRKSCSGLTRASKKHKAEPHDMYIESSALQRRFMPQPLMRSSWQQLVMFSLDPNISYRFPCQARE